MQVKIFSSAATLGNLVALEAEVNAWLAHVEPHIISFAQTARGSDLVLTFLYEERISAAAQGVAEASAVVPDIPDAIERGLEETTLDPTSDAPLLPEAELPY
jgi:hypothetical protein